MADRDVELAGRQRGGEHRVGIALHQDDVGAFPLQDALHSDEYPGRLLCMRTRADLKVIAGLRELQLLKEDPAQVVRVVLAGVEDEMFYVRGSMFRVVFVQSPYHRGHLDDFRASPDYYGDLHLAVSRQPAQAALQPNPEYREGNAEAVPYRV